MKKIDIINSLISYVGIGIMFILMMIRANVFTVEEVGIYSYIIGVSTVLAAILNFGIPRIILKFYCENRNNNFFKQILKIQIFIFIIFLAICMIINKVVYLEYIYFILLLTFNLLMIKNIDMISMVTNKATKSNVYQKLYLNIMDIIILGFLFMIDRNVYVYISSYLIIKYFILLLIFYLVKKDIFFNSNEKIEKKFLKRYLNFGLFIMLNSAASILTNTVDKIMLKNYIDFKAVGMYTVALTLGNVIGIVGIAFIRSMPPKISNYLNQNDKKSLEDLYKENVQYQLYIGLFSFVYLTLFSKEILSIMGKEYIESYIVLTFIAIAQLVNIGTGMCGTIIGLSKYYKYEAYFNASLLILTIGTNVLFIPLYGIVGAAFATALTLILINLMKLMFVYIKYKMYPYRLQNVKYIISMLVTSIFIIVIKYFFIFNIIGVSILLVPSIIVYESVLYILKERNLLSLKLIEKIKNKL